MGLDFWEPHMMGRIAHNNLKQSDPHGTGHPGMYLTGPIGESPIVTIYPANHWQKPTHGGKTTQITARADKVCAMGYAYLSAGGPTDESSCWWEISPA